MTDATRAWALVVPVKRLDRAKSRLAPAAGWRRPELALAFAHDTVAAALAAPAVREVLVVTDDPRAAAVLGRLGAGGAAGGSRVRIVPDEPGTGLNAALAHGAAAVAGGLGTAALSADLPALRPAELSRVLAAAAGRERAFLRDAAGVGTTVLAARPGVALAPAFGGASAARHGRSGAAELALPAVESVRRDVDTGADLAAAVRLGVGPRTAAVLAAPAPAG